MITFIVMLIVLLVVAAILAIVPIIGTAGLAVVFGDVIVFALIVWAIVRLIKFIKRKRK